MRTLRRPGTPIRLAATQSEAFGRLAPGNYHRIARRAGMSVAHVSRIVRGIRGARLDTAERIAEAAGVTVHDLTKWRALQKRDQATAA